MGREQRLAPAGRQADTAIGRRAFQPLDRGIAALGKSRRTVALRLIIAFDPRDRRRIGRAEIARTALAEEKRSEEHTSELQSLMRISYAVFCLKKKKKQHNSKIKTSRTTITTP